MLIRNIYLPASVGEYGLKDISLLRLGRLVALAGKNGAGKSRLLSACKDVIKLRERARPGLESLRKEINSYESSALNNPSSLSVEAWKRSAADLKKVVLAATEWIVTDQEGFFGVLSFIPKELELKDPRSMVRGEVVSRASKAIAPGAGEYHENTLFYLHHILEEWFSATHPESSLSAEEGRAAKQRYEELQVLVERMLGGRLERNYSGDPMLFGKPIADAKLSEGQRVLLQLSVALHAQGKNLDNTVLLLDEPENHLHPSAVIEVVKALHEATSTSQIFIATHSVPLLAYMASIDPMCLWYVTDGGVQHAGRRPELVLDSLLGGEDGIAQLNSFTGLPAILAAVNYATESLYPPKVIGASGADPQVTQIQKVISSIRKFSEVFRVLDIGAGKGRLLEGLAASMQEDGLRISDVVDYHAYDPFPEDQAVCEALISSHYGVGEARYFSTPDRLFALKDESSFGLVVLCNVLHEIPPDMWVETLGRNGVVSRALNDEGYLLVVEDQRIPVGEKAHRNGFLVLDTVHLRALFCITEADVQAGFFVSHDARGDGRLKAHMIKKCLLGRIGPETVVKAIKELRETSRREIRMLRERDPSYANGQLNGFWTQQFANASLSLAPE